MDKQRIIYLHHHYLNDSLSEQELKDWNALLRDKESQLFLSSLMDTNWERMMPLDKISLRDNRADEILSYISMQPQKQKSIKINWLLRIAAAVFLFALGIYFYTLEANKNQKDLYVQQVKPGTQSATLTLANGKKIRLSDVSEGEIANEAGISVSKTTDGELVYEIKTSSKAPNKTNTLSTSKGETYILTLPDKSKVWLNAASSLTYSTTLKQDGKRKVKLTGEAYFEIAKDASHPFIVETKEQQIEVLGTHFNLNCYDDELVTKTTLLEGSVKVWAIRTGNAQLLKPGQQSLLSNNQLQVKAVDTDEAIAWKNGYFQFDGKNLETALLELSRWYNVDIVYKDNSLRKQALAGSISKYKQVEDVLKTMELTGLLKFNLLGRTIVVERY